MYGATAARTQSHTAIGVRPPFRVVWSRGLGSLIEFPAVVANGVAYIGNFRGTVYALSMRKGTVLWRHSVRRSAIVERADRVPVAPGRSWRPIVPIDQGAIKR